MSDKRRRLMKERKPVVQSVFERDGYLCRANGMPGVGKCHGRLTPHEVLNRERAGRRDENLLDPDGIITLCSFHNTWVEDNPRKAEILGLAVHAWDRPSPKSAPGRDAIPRASESAATPPTADDPRPGAVPSDLSAVQSDAGLCTGDAAVDEELHPRPGRFASYTTRGDAA